MIFNRNFPLCNLILLMDEQEELKSCYRKNRPFIDEKIYLNARFFDEVFSSTIQHKKRKILSAAKTILNGTNLRIENLLRTSDIDKKQHTFVFIGLMHILIVGGMLGLSWTSRRRSFVSLLSGHQLIPDIHPSASYQLFSSHFSIRNNCSATTYCFYQYSSRTSERT